MTGVPPAFALRPLRLSDVAEIATIHRAAFSRSAITKLGPVATRRYYDWLLTGPHDQLAIGAFEGDLMVGFLFGGLFRGAMSGFLNKNRTYLAWRVATRPWLLANPLFRNRLGKALTIFARQRKKPSVEQIFATVGRRRSFGILAIATDPGRQGRGVGRALMQHAEDAARTGDFTRMNLSVLPENRTAVRFYEGLGWEKVGTEHEWGGYMTKDVGKQPVVE